MTMTIELYARTKQWLLENVVIRLRHSRIYAKDCKDCVVRDDTRLDRIDTAVELSGPLTAEQHGKLMEVAPKCPVHRTPPSRIQIPEGTTPTPSNRPGGTSGCSAHWVP